MLEKLNLFRLIDSTITLVLVIWKWTFLFLVYSKFSWSPCISLFLKLFPTKSQPWFVQWSSFLLTQLFILINLPYGFACNTVVMTGLMSLTATKICYVMVRTVMNVRTVRNVGYIRTVGHSLVVSLGLLGHCRDVANLSLFYILSSIQILPPGVFLGWGVLFSYKYQPYKYT